MRQHITKTDVFVAFVGILSLACYLTIALAPSPPTNAIGPTWIANQKLNQNLQQRAERWQTKPKH